MSVDARPRSVEMFEMILEGFIEEGRHHPASVPGRLGHGMDETVQYTVV